MSKLKTKGFVMSVYPFKERDKMVHLLTPEHGLISARARGAAGLKSKMRPLSNLFSLCDYQLFEYKGRYTIDDGDIIESFIGVTDSFERLAGAAHAAEVFSDVARHSHPDRKIFELWAYTLYEISVNEKPVLISRVGVMRLLSDIGYTPCVHNCVRCQRPLTRVSLFSHSLSGLLCDRVDCQTADREAVPVSGAIVALLQHIVSAPYGRLYRFKLASDYEAPAGQLIDRYVDEKMEKEYKRLSLLSHPFEIDPSALRRNRKVISDDDAENRR